MLKKNVKKLDIIELKTAINFAIQIDEKEEFDAGFKFALLMNDEALQPIVKKVHDIVSKKSQALVDEYKELYQKYKQSQLKEDGKDGETEDLIVRYKIVFGLLTFAVPDFANAPDMEEEYNDAYAELEKVHEKVIKELDTLVNEAMNINLEVVHVDKVSRLVGYSVMKRLKLMLKS